MTISHSPYTICDTGHNEDSIKMIIDQLKKINFNDLHIVFGMVNDKSIDIILNLLPKNAEYYFCNAQIPRSMNSKILFEKAKDFQLSGNYFKSVADAYNQAKLNAEEDDLIFIGGSTFVVAEVI